MIGPPGTSVDRPRGGTPEADRASKRNVDEHRHPEHSTPLGQPHIGEVVALGHLPGCFLVVEIDDSALLTLRAPSGAILKAGWRTIIRLGDPSQGGRP